MLTLNDTVTNDPDVKFALQIIGDSTVYLTDSLSTLSLTNDYISGVLFADTNGATLGQITDSSNIDDGGGLGEVSSCDLGIKNFNKHTTWQAWINRFYPAIDGEYLVGQEVRIGFIWNGVIDADITWLKRFYIEEQTYDATNINCYVIEKSELDWMDLPYYEIQKDYDNNISYFPNAPEESLGLAIPIAYGDFFTDILEINPVNYNPSVAPGLSIDRGRSTFVFTSHKCYDDSYNQGIESNEYYVMKYINSLDAYEQLYKTGTSAGNSISGHSIQMQYTPGILLGDLVIKLTTNSIDSNLTDINNIADQDTDTYSELNANVAGTNQVVMRTGKTFTDSDIGTYDINDSASIVYFRIKSSDATSRSNTVTFTNNTLPTPTTATGTSTPLTGAESTPVNRGFDFSAEELGLHILWDGVANYYTWDASTVQNLDFVLINGETTVGKIIRVYDAFLYISALQTNNIIGFSNVVRNTFEGRGRITR